MPWTQGLVSVAAPSQTTESEPLARISPSLEGIRLQECSLHTSENILQKLLALIMIVFTVRYYW